MIKLYKMKTSSLAGVGDPCAFYETAFAIKLSVANSALSQGRMAGDIGGTTERDVRVHLSPATGGGGLFSRCVVVGPTSYSTCLPVPSHN